MNTPSSPEASHRLRTVIAGTACVATIAGLGALSLARSQAADLRTTTTTTVDRGLPASADAADAWLAPSARSPQYLCRPDAAQRWQVPEIAPADLPRTADGAEAWLRPEIAIADLPHTADAMERWLCAP